MVGSAYLLIARPWCKLFGWDIADGRYVLAGSMTSTPVRWRYIPFATFPHASTQLSSALDNLVLAPRPI